MASILDRYGIKEVADVTFYELNELGMPEYPVLYLDTLKVSTIEQTAEEAEARGGKGNAALIGWDYGKEITVTLEDALFSAKSLAIMFSNGLVEEYSGNAAYIMKSEQFLASAAKGGTMGWDSYFYAPDGKRYEKINAKFYEADGTFVGTSAADLKEGTKYFCSYDLAVSGSVIEISANSFPGTYYITGDTFARAEVNGKDEFFQFIVPKAKVQSSNTITLEADGDPSVFNMSLKVLRPADGIMMKLVKYNLENPNDELTDDVQIYHNHVLNENNMSELAD